jgi:stage V sporulation protein G
MNDGPKPMNGLSITEVRVSLRDDAKLKAFVSITLNDCFVIRGLKIIEGNRGTFVAMPSRKRPDNTFQDIAHPINNEGRAWMEEVVLAAYHRELEKQPVR